MSPPPAGLATKQVAVRCINCPRTFANRQELEAHLFTNNNAAANHFPCRFCSIDHRTPEALKRHLNQLHAAEQDLKCPGCKKSFNRLGGLMAHMELKECKFIPSGYIENLRTNDPRNSGMFEKIRAATSWEGVDHSQLAEITRQTELSDISATISQSSSTDTPSSCTERAAEEEEDLISFEEVDGDTAFSLILNNWEQPITIFAKDDFPALKPASKIGLSEVSNRKTSYFVQKSAINKDKAQSYAPVKSLPKRLTSASSTTLHSVTASSNPRKTLQVAVPPVNDWSTGSMRFPTITTNSTGNLPAVGAWGANASKNSASKIPLLATSTAAAWVAAFSAAPGTKAVSGNAPSKSPACGPISSGTAANEAISSNITPAVTAAACDAASSKATFSWAMSADKPPFVTPWGPGASSAQASKISSDPAPPAPLPASAWGNSASRAPASTILFPKALPAVAPPAALMENLSLNSAEIHPKYDEHDPDASAFKPERYFDNWAQKYRCPHCKKTKESVPAFIQHLKSPIHRKDLQPVTCHACLRKFPNTTALTQHMESQAVRCDARNAENADIHIQTITQVARIDGLHEDDTNRYVNLDESLIDPTTVVNSVTAIHRAAVDARAKFQEDHWKTHSYDNW